MGRFQLNLHHVISFYFLAKEQSFSRAAERLAITQPAVTQHVRGLETQFGTKLIILRKQRVHLTKAGEELFAYAEELFNQAVLTENFLKNYHFNNLAIGMAGGLTFFLTNLIDHFKEIYPSIKVTIREGFSKSLIEELLNYQHDICFTGILAPYSSKLRSYRVDSDEQMVFVAGPKNPLFGKAPAKWEQLASQPLIIQSEGSAGREFVRFEFKKRGLKPTIGAEVSNIELAKELAKQNKGVALLFAPNVCREVDRGELKIIRVEDGEIRMGGFYVVTNRKVKISPTVESFLTSIKEYFNSNFHDLPVDYQPEAWSR